MTWSKECSNKEITRPSRGFGDDVKREAKVFKAATRWSRGGHKVVASWSQGGPKVVPRWSGGAQEVLKRCSSGGQEIMKLPVVRPGQVNS